MKLSVMQPYFFPYIGYFQLIHACDRFVIADEVQYIRHGWVNRNRILKQNGGSQYIIAPVARHHYRTSIGSVRIAAEQNWVSEILKKLEFYRKAPGYKNTLELVRQCFSGSAETIALLNKKCLEIICTYLDINKKIEVQSDLSLDYSQVVTKTDRVIQICRQLGASSFLNPIGGKEIYCKDDFKNRGIELNFLQPDIRPYQQFSETFEPSLSILDVLMFNDKETVKNMLNQFRLV